MKFLPLLMAIGMLGTATAQEHSSSTREKNVHILSENFEIPQLNRERRIWIYLPPSYTSSNKKFPVLYLHDGQNLFDKATSYAGEWGVDETLNTLSKEGYAESIVVGIDNGGEKRMDELSPFKNEEYKAGGSGDEYLAFVVETLKPYIDSHYRTKASRKNTTLGGSSLGALISVYGGVKYPDTFGNILAFSSAFWFNREPLMTYIKESDHSLRKQRYYFIEGEKESFDMGKDTSKVITLLKEKGVKTKNVFYKVHPDGKHNEAYWNREFPGAYKWLH
ncbi:alpha/beta hydrolase [Chryseobacterium sp. A301]